MTFLGTDSVAGGGGIDTVTGTGAGDSISINGANAVTTASIGFTAISTVDGAGGNDTITATGGNDNFVVSGANAFSASGIGFASSESVAGNGGTDTVTGTNAGDTVTIDGAGTVTTSGISFSAISTVDGSGGNDTITATAGNDNFVVSGANAFTTSSIGFTNVESVAGNGGTDTVTGTGVGDAVTINGASAATTAGIAFTAISAVDGVGGNDTITGTAGGDNFSVTANNAFTASSIGFTSVESVAGGGGTDTVSGTAGGDSYTINGGNAVTTGMIAFTAVSTVDGANGTDTVTGTAGTDNFTLAGANAFNTSGIGFTNMESVAGNGGSDTVTGSGSGDAIAITGANAVSANGVSFSAISTVDGAGGTDTITGTGGGDNFTVTGTNAFNTSSIGFANIESVAGGGGTDTVTGTGSGDAITINGASAVTTSSIGFTAIATVDGAGGNDTVTGTAGADNFTVTGANTLTSSSIGFSSIESVAGGGGTDTVTATGGNDAISLNGANSVTTSAISLSAISTVDAAGGTDTVTGTAGGDNFTISGANAFNASSVGFTNVESVAAGGGTDTVTGTGGGDAFSIDGANAVTSSGLSFTAVSTVSGAGGTDTVTATAGNENFTVTGANAFTAASIGFTNMESVAGNGGTDTVTGTGAGDSITITGANALTTSSVSFSAISTVDGSGGNDTITLGSGVASFGGAINGGAGTDTLGATDGANTFALSGADAGALNATTNYSAIEALSGGTGADLFNFTGGSISGSIAGGSGTDELNYSALGTDVVVNLTTGSATNVNSGSGGSVSGVENATGGGGNDALTGSAGNNTLVGNNGSDTLADGAGDDSLNGGMGDDTYLMTPGSADVISDAGGVDTADFSGSSAGITIDMDSGAVQIVNTGNTVQLSGTIEHFTGSGFDDNVSVDAVAFARTMAGGAGTNDVLNIDAGGELPTDTGTSFTFPTLGTITYSGWETINITNLPGGAQSPIINGTGASEDVGFAYDGTNMTLTKNGVTYNYLGVNLQAVTINGGAGDDTLQIDLSGSNFIPANGLVFNGGTGTTDTIEVLGGSRTSLNYTPADPAGVGGAGSGTLTFTGGGDGVISFTGLEPALVTTTVANLTIDLSALAAGEELTLEDVGTNSDQQSQVSFVNNNLEDLIFVNPTTSFTITGSNFDDIIHIDGLDSVDGLNNGLSANLTLNAGLGDDIIDFNAKTGSGTWMLDGGAHPNSDELQGPETGNVTWTLTGANAGTIANAGGTGVTSFATVETLQGGAANDTFNLGVSTTMPVRGGAGNDTFNVTSDYQSTIQGETGNDTININFGTTLATYSGGDNDDTINVNADFTGVASGDNNNDTFVINQENHGTFQGNAGNDTFDVNARSHNSVDGGTGTDTLDLASANPTNATVASLSAGTGANLVDVTNVDGGATGIDVLTGGTSGTLTGENAARTWLVQAPSSYTDGATTLSFTGFSTLQGGTGVDSINIANDSTRTIRGGDGNDVVTFTANNVTATALDGQAGTDEINYSGYTTGVTVRLNVPSATNVSTFSNFENATGGSGADLLVGSGVANTLSGLSGNDTIIGLGGNDSLVGGSNNDIYEFRGAFGTDTIDEAGGGTDTITFAASVESGAAETSMVTVNVQAGTVTTAAGGTINFTPSQIDNILSGSHASDIFQGANANSTWTLSGNGTQNYVGAGATIHFENFETLQGGSSTDTFNVTSATTASLRGGAGSDTLQGSQIDLVTLTGSGANGFTGTEASTGGFAEIDQINGNGTGAVLTGRNVDSTWTLNLGGTGGTYNDGANNVGFSGFNLLQAGSDDDNFNVTVATNVSIAGGLGDDTLTGGGNVSITGSDATGYSGDSTFLTGGSPSFTGINEFVGGGGSFTGNNLDVIWTVNTMTVLYDEVFDGIGVNVVILSGYSLYQGGSGIDTFNIQTDSASSLGGGGGNDVFNFDTNGVTVAGVSGGTGTDLLDYTDYTTGIGVNLNNAAGNTGIGTLTLGDIENLTGGSGNDTLQGASSPLGASANELRGGQGNDTYGFSNNYGNDTVIDSTGTETLNFSAVTTAVNVNLQTQAATTTGGNVGFTSTDIDSVVGGSGTDTLTGQNAGATWTLDGAPDYASPSGSPTTAVGFSGVELLQGGTGNDTFNVMTATAVSVAGGAGTDTLTGSLIDNVTLTAASTANGYAGTEASLGGFGEIDDITATPGSTITGRDANSTWSLGATQTYSDAAGGGAGGTLTISNFTTLNGGSQIDTFDVTAPTTATLNGGAGADVFGIDLAAGGALTGNIDGQANGANLSYAGQANAATVAINTIGGTTGFLGTATGVSGTFDNITTVTGGTGSDTLIGDDASSAWNLAGVTTYVSGGRTLTFSAIDSLQGNTADDTFTVTAAFAGTINGAAGSDTLTGTAIDSVTITGSSGDGFDGQEDSIAAGVANGFRGINSIVANGGTFTGANEDVFWTVNTANVIYDPAPVGAPTLALSGYVTYQGGSGVDDFTVAQPATANLNGGDGNDIFDLDAILTGDVNGEAGTDELDISAFNPSNATITGLAADGAALGTIAGFAGGQIASGIDTLTGNATGTLTGFNAAGGSVWNINALNGTYSDGGTTSTLTFTGFDTLQGDTTAGTDLFLINANSMRVLLGGAGNDVFEFTVNGLTATVLNGEGGTDSIDYDGYTTGVSVNLQTDIADNVASLLSIENAFGGSGNDTLTGANGEDNELGGGAGNDTYVFDDNIGNDEITENPAEGTDTINLTAIAANLTVDFGTSPQITGTGSIDVTGLGNFESLLSGTGTDTLIGADADATWTLGASDVYSSVAAGIAGITFMNFENLTGGTANDNFVLNTAHTVNISGGTGAADSLSGAAVDQVTVAGSTADGYFGNEDSLTPVAPQVFGFQQIDFVIGNGAAGSTFTGQNTDSLWTLSTGSQTYDNDPMSAGPVIDVSGFSTLQGGTGVDTFNITAGSAVSYVLRGGASGDIFNINGQLTGSIFAEGGQDQFNVVTSDGGNVTGIMDGGTSALLSFFGDANSIFVTLTAAGTIDGFLGTSSGGAFDNVTTLQGSNAGTADTLNGANGTAT